MACFGKVVSGARQLFTSEAASNVAEEHDREIPEVSISIDVCNETHSHLSLESSHFAEGEWIHDRLREFIRPGDWRGARARNRQSERKGVKGGIEFEIGNTEKYLYIGFENSIGGDIKSFIAVDKNKSAKWACENISGADKNLSSHGYYLTCCTENPAESKFKKLIFTIRQYITELYIINSTPYDLYYEDKFVKFETTSVESPTIKANETETIVVSDSSGHLAEVAGGLKYTIDGKQLFLYIYFSKAQNGNYKAFIATDENKSAQWACEKSREGFYETLTADGYYLSCFTDSESKLFVFTIRKDIIFLNIINSTPCDLCYKNKFVKPENTSVESPTIKAYDTKTIKVTNPNGCLGKVAGGFKYTLESQPLYIGFSTTENGNYKAFIAIDKDKSAEWACKKSREDFYETHTTDGYYLSCDTHSKFKDFVFIIRKEDTAKFIISNFKQRECSKYAKMDKSKSNACQCGRTIEWHIKKGIDINTEHTEWKLDTHSKTVRCTSFGEISFKGVDHHTQNSHYVRLDSETNLEKVWELLMNYWKLPVPKLLISVTGGAKHFDVKSEMKDILKQALCEAATSTGAWIITGGTGKGIIKMVGEAVNEYIPPSKQNEKMLTLGIATWGIVSNREALEAEGDNGLFSATYDPKDIKKNAKGVPLDHNHSHFILVDNGTENIYGGEIEFRTKLEKYISIKIAEESGLKQSQEPVPIVTLVVGGGENTMATVRESVKEKIPVFVIEGTGRAADLISQGYKLTETSEKKSMKNIARKKILMDSISKNNSDEISSDLKQILECRNLITLLKLETKEDISQEILRALIKAKKLDVKTQLKWALEWNCCDIAKNEIFNEENRQNLEKIKLDELMMTALVENRVDFVKLFIDNDTDIHIDVNNFLTIKNLHSLYYKLYKKKTEFFNLLIDDIRNTWTAFILLKSTEPSGNFPDLLIHVGILIEHLLWPRPFDFYSDKRLYNLNNCRDSIKVQNPEQHLFIWAVLFNRTEMAELFWKLGKDQLGAGLIASALLKSLSKKAKNKREMELHENLTEHAKFFERFSKNLLSVCYDVDKDVTYQLLLRELPSWKNLTLFKIADTYEMMDFMEHSSCQIKLNIIWKGQMDPYTSGLMIVLCMIFPIFLPLIEFTSKDKPNIVIKRQIGSNKVENESASDTSGFLKTQNTKYRVTLFDSEKTINILSACMYFYAAPVTKFFFSMLSYFVLLVIFSYFVLLDLRPVGEPQSPSMWEIIAWIWVLTMIVEKIRQVYISREQFLKYEILTGTRNHKQSDLNMYIMFTVCIILRMSLIDSDFIWARRMYSVTLIMFYLRSMQFLLAEEKMGAKVIMIYNTLPDLVYFFCIILVFVVSFGIAYQVNMYPNSPQSWMILKDVFLMPYFQMYGELFLERVEGEETPGCIRIQSIWQQDDPDLKCQEADGLSTLLLAVYLLLINLFLVNILIAIFSNTFHAAEYKSRKVWRFYRFSLISEYWDCPTLVPPFNILEHLFQIIRWIPNKTCNICEIPNGFKKKKEGNKRLTQFEKVATNLYLTRTNPFYGQKLNAEEHSVSGEIARLSQCVDDLSEQSTQQTQKISEQSKKFSQQTQKISQQMKKISEQTQKISEQSQKISKIMQMLETLINEKQQTPTREQHQSNNDATKEDEDA